MTVCPKCGYERKTNDDNFVNAEECPKCGIFYEKWKPSSISTNTEPILTSSEVSNINKERKTIRYKSIILAAIIFIVLAISAKFTFFSRIESTLPVTPPLGMESNSYLIRARGENGAITAAGQIFTPSCQTPVLFKLGFLFTQYRFTKEVPGFKFQVRLSEWAGARPGPTELWVSEPRDIPITNDDFQVDWVDFNVPYLSLDPNKQYIAWVTLSGLGNPPDASVGIPGMGPIYSTPLPDRERKLDYGKSPYPQGMRALYKQENPDGDVSQMKNSAWEVHDIGQNLHFRMSFENKRIVVCGITLFINSKNKHDNKEVSHSTNTEKEKQREENERRRIELEQQREKQVEREEQRKQEWEESERQRIETEQQQKQQREESEQRRRQQQVEAEIQQYEREQQQNEMKQKQDEMRQQQGNRLNRGTRRVQRIPSQ